MRIFFILLATFLTLFSTENDPHFLSLRQTLSFQNIVLDELATAYTFYNLDAVGAFAQGTKEHLQTYVKGLKPLPIFNSGVDAKKITEPLKNKFYNLPHFPKELKNNNADLLIYVFAYASEAFGKEGNPLFIYVSRKIEENETTNAITEEDFNYVEKLLSYQKTCSLIDFILTTQQTDFHLFFQMCEKLAEIGIIEAQLVCAKAYGHIAPYDQCQVTKNSETAFSYWQDAAHQGNAAAQYNCGILLYRGDGVKKDEEKAFECLKLAASNGHAPAHYKCGLAYCQFESYGCPLDYGRALYYFDAAAKQGHEDAHMYCGIMHRDGLGTQKDLKKALYHFEYAACKGEMYAQYECALFYAKVTKKLYPSIKANTRKAFYYAKKATDQGHKDAAMLCAQMYFYGSGIRKNLKKADYYLKF